MTTLLDDSDTSCPHVDIRQEDGTIVVLDRNTELSLMDNNTSTCLRVLTQGRVFQRMVAYFYVPTSEYALQFVLDISGMECTQPSVVVYHGYNNGGIYVECILTGAHDIQGIQQCEFMCTNICPQESVVEIHVQTQKVSGNPNYSPMICGISLSYE